MNSLIWIFGVIIFFLGGGWAYSSYKNRQIRKYEKQNKDLAFSKAVSDADKRNAEQKADAAVAAKRLQERTYRAMMGSRRTETASSTPLSEEDRKLAKAIMDNHDDADPGIMRDTD